MLSEEQIVSALLARERISEALSLASFKRVCRLLRNEESAEQIHWLIILLGDQAFVQALRMPHVAIEISEVEKRHYSANDFSFLGKGQGTLFGSIHGKLTARQLVQQTLGWSWLRYHALLLVGVTILAYFLPHVLLVKVTDSTINALAIFVSVFVLFVLNVNPEQEYRYLASGRYSIMAQSDRYIAIVGFAALASTVLSAGALTITTREYPTLVRLIQSSIFGFSVVLTIASFSLVIWYHFDRRQQLVEIQMAKSLLSEIQSQSTQNQTNSRG